MGFESPEAIDLRLDQLSLQRARLWVRRVKEGSLSVEQPIAGDELRALRRLPPLDDQHLGGLFSQLAFSLMQEIEKLITSHSPETFPNRLAASGYPVDEQELLERLCLMLETKIGKELQETDGDAAYAAWQNCVGQWERSVAAESEFLEQAECLIPRRYFDPRRIINAAHWRQRLAYLTAIHEEMIGEVGSS